MGFGRESIECHSTSVASSISALIPEPQIGGSILPYASEYLKSLQCQWCSMDLEKLEADLSWGLNGSMTQHHVRSMLLQCAQLNVKQFTAVLIPRPASSVLTVTLVMDHGRFVPSSCSV